MLIKFILIILIIIGKFCLSNYITNIPTQYELERLKGNVSNLETQFSFKLLDILNISLTIICVLIALNIGWNISKKIRSWKDED